MESKSFELNTPSLFESTSTTTIKNSEFIIIAKEKLHHYSKHKFPLYAGNEKEEFIANIKENGILVPLIVQPCNQLADEYEILSGHNRFECGKEAGLSTFECIVRKNLSEDDVTFIVNDTNIFQRGFDSVPHSARAKCIAQRYSAIKSQGKRTDLIQDVEKIMNSYDNDNNTSLPVATKLNSKEIIGRDYGISPDTVARYLRISKLNFYLSDLLDCGKLSIRSAVDLSFLALAEQDLLSEYLQLDWNTVSLEIAKDLKQLSRENGGFNEKSIDEIFKGKKKVKKQQPKISFKKEKFIPYFKEGTKEKDMEKTIIDALEFYFSHKDELTKEV